ncbi:MAG: beta-ketoacyl synthase N-terminal-like domain-containing protein [Chloroflexota bacterium]|nr:beta-ketoacyl synthase N-terminal-like domain-containing protein [Chloroflexota bacterium]
MANRELGRGVTIIGGAMSHFGSYSGKSGRDLMVEAYTDAVGTVDKGIDTNDIEALYIGNFAGELFERQGHMGHIMADWLGLVPRPSTRIEGACASSGLAFREAVIAIASGLYDVVLAGGVEKMTNVPVEKVQDYLAAASDVPYELDLAAFTFPGLYAVMATAYMSKFGASTEHLMQVAIKNHDNGALNPKAQFNSTIKSLMEQRIERALAKGLAAPDWRDEYDFLRDEKSNPIVADPLRLMDCSPVTDGASCVILAAEEVAKEYTDEMVNVVGTSPASAGPFTTWGSNITSIPSARLAGRDAYAMAGVTAKDIDFAEVHDCFTFAEIMAVEDLGFFEQGRGAFASADGETASVSDRPINISGGLKSKGHPVGATGIAQIQEVWTQLRGRAGGRQISHKDLRLGLTHNVGGTGGTCVVHVLERQ